MNTAAHHVAPDEVMAFLDGELPAALAQAVSGHLKQCADCASLAAQLGETKTQLAGWQVESLTPAAEAKMQEAAGKLFPGPQGISSILLREVYAVSRLKPAMALCGVAIVFLLLSRGSGKSPREPVSEHMASVGAPKSTPSGSIARGAQQIMLFDGKPSAGQSHAGKSGTYERPGDDGSSAFAVSSRDESSEDNGPAPAATPIHQPMIARNVSLTIVTKDFASSRAAIEAILARHHGYAAQLTASTAESAPRSINASLRVPAGELALALAELKSLGHVENESQSGEEVTQQHADLVARLKNSRETEHRLQAILLQRTGKIADVLAVEEEISRVRGEIEEMEAEQKSLEHRVDFATVELRVSEEYKAQLDNSSPSASTRIHNSLVAGYKGAAETLLGFVLFFAEAGPTLLIWLVIALVPALLLLRRYRRAVAAS